MELGMREWLILGGVILVLAVLIDGFRRMRSERKSGIRMSLGMGGSIPETDPFGSELPNGGARVINRTEPVIGEEPVIGDEPVTAREPVGQPATAHRQSSSQTATDDMPDFVGEHELLALHVKSNSANGFNGSDLLQVLLACDMRYGERNILHRHEKADGKGYLQFSVANMIEPGTFNLEDINSFRTPGVTFFMGLPGPEDPVQALECMIETANCLVKNLDAYLLDEDHVPASAQVINHYRDRVRNFVQQHAKAELA